MASCACSDAIAVPSAVELAVVMASMIDGTADMTSNVIAIATTSSMSVNPLESSLFRLLAAPSWS